MKVHRSLVRLACACLTVIAVESRALAQGQFFLHFSKQTPGAAPSRYVLPGVEADNDGGGHGAPSGVPVPCNDKNTNPSVVRIWLTDELDETPWRVAPPGDFKNVNFEYHVTLQLTSSINTLYGCDYELYTYPQGSEEDGVPVERIVVDGDEFIVLEIPVGAIDTADERIIEIRFLSDPGLTPESLKSVSLDIISAEIIDPPPTPPTLSRGANGRVTWFIEDNDNPTPVGMPGDECDLAFPIAAAGTHLFDTEGMTASSVPVTCTGTPADVWFEFTAPVTADFFFDTYDSGIGGLVEVYAGTCASLVSLGCNDGSLIKLKGSGVEIACTGGMTYYVRVGENGSGSGLGTLTVKDLRSGLGAFVQFGHTTPSTRTVPACLAGRRTARPASAASATTRTTPFSTVVVSREPRRASQCRTKRSRDPWSAPAARAVSPTDRMPSISSADGTRAIEFVW